jgi:1-aminocyclopropane-1-carboxylate deaminase
LQPVFKKSFLQPLEDPLFEKKNLKVFVLRDDIIHPFISGNKWRKLKYNIDEFRRQGKEYLVTFGGGYSNHIVATAAAGKEFGINTIGIIRGEELNTHSNPVLHFANECGMKLVFISREKYRSFREDNSLVFHEPGIPGTDLYMLPEGGSNEFAIKGCEEIPGDIAVDFDFICCASGTGATLAGITKGLKKHQKSIGIAVLKDAGSLDEAVKGYIGSKNNFQVIRDYHFGGYAKSTGELDLFCQSFIQKNNIPIEPVYTGKLFFGIYDLIRKNFFETGKTIVLVHTGGIFDFNTQQSTT